MPETARFMEVETEAKKLITSGQHHCCDLVLTFPETFPMSWLSSFPPPPYASSTTELWV